MKNAIQRDLSPLRRSFLIQGSRYLIGGLFLISIPFFTYARGAALKLDFGGSGQIDAQLIVSLIYMLVILHGILFSVMGPLIILGGLAYVKRAQELLNTGASSKVLLDLKMRQSPLKVSLNGGMLLDAVVTYEDGSQENFKFVSRENQNTLANLIAQSTQVELFGEPKSNPKPRVISTAHGLLLEQPNELGLIGAIFGFSDKSKFLHRRMKTRAIAFVVMFVAYVAFFSPISFNLAMFPAQAKPILSITVIASLVFLLFDLIESLKLARLQNSLSKVDCQFTRLKRGIKGLFNPKIARVNVIFKDDRESKQANLLLESFGKVPVGEPFYGSAYVDSTGNIIGIVNGATDLVKSKVAHWTVAPLVLYLVSMPLCVPLMQPDFKKEYKFNNGHDYYQQGILYKTYGWTEKAREAMLEAENFDAKTAKKAQIYIRTRLPHEPISKEAERMNIKGYNLMASRKTEQAIRVFKDCINLYPEFEWPYGNLGYLYVKQGDFKQAKFYLDKAVAINPFYINGLQHLAEMELRRGHSDRALEYLNRISEADPGDYQVELQKLAIKTSI